MGRIMNGPGLQKKKAKKMGNSERGARFASGQDPLLAPSPLGKHSLV